jgi:hypothetical protein
MGRNNRLHGTAAAAENRNTAYDVAVVSADRGGDMENPEGRRRVTAQASGTGSG